MTTGYRDGKPDKGQNHCAFRTIKDVKAFLKLQGTIPSDANDFWTIKGELVSDDGEPDGLVIKVDSFEKLRF